TSQHNNRNDRAAGFQLTAGAGGRFPFLLGRGRHERASTADAIEVDFLPSRAVQFAISTNPGAHFRQGPLGRFALGLVPAQRRFQANGTWRWRSSASRQAAGNGFAISKPRHRRFFRSGREEQATVEEGKQGGQKKTNATLTHGFLAGLWA